MGLLAKEFAPLFRAYDMQAPEVPDREELQAEYVRLFVNNLGFVPAVPYASYHLDDGGLLRGRSYFRLVEIMRAAGFELRDRVTEQADHVAVLFEFCSLLAEAVRKGQDAEQNLQTLAAVLREFIAPTVQGLAAALREHAHFDFYPRIAALGQEVLQDAADIAEKTTAAGNGENA
jgi:TorA maturation chaperone TorD